MYILLYNIYPMSNFDIIHTNAAEAEEFIAHVGGMPEIMRASADLMSAIDQTYDEIAGAIFDPARFPATPVPPEQQTELGLLRSTAPLLRAALTHEGKSGAKRFQLETDLRATEHTLFRLMHRIVEIRTDLKVSQQEM